MTELLHHPRPQLRRESFELLDGEWEFADDPQARWRWPQHVEWNATIQVPFAPETEASGIGTTGYRRAVWYRKRLVLPETSPGGHLLLHFNAVDYRTTVWVDGAPAGSHEGGYSPFSVDLAAYADGQEHEIVVRADDDPTDLAKPRGKQDWELEPHLIWYPRTTGIWQSVWLEQVPRVSIYRLHWGADLDRYALSMHCTLRGPYTADMRLRVRLSYNGRLLIDDMAGILGTRVDREFVLDGLGLDMMRDELTWRPEHPALIDAVVEMLGPDGEVIDRIESYTGMRTIGVTAGHFVLNGRPIPLRLVLDQGYWPESGLTPPSEEALRHDVELAKAMGFNGVRKHQKIEDPRYLYWADRLGLMVWAELPPAYRFDEVAMGRAVTQWTEAIERDRSHPCIVTWVTFNESAGLLALPTREDQRQYLAAMARLTKALDPSRLVVSNDGWEGLDGDMVGIHDYDADPEAFRERYATENLPATIAGFGGNGRLQVVDGHSNTGSAEPLLGARALVISEFGGFGLTEAGPVLDHKEVMGIDEPPDRSHTAAAWGYSNVRDGNELVQRYGEFVKVLLSLDRISGFCYTQFADTYQEVNGLLYGDRTPKAPLEAIARATLGPFRSRLGVLQPTPPPLPGPRSDDHAGNAGRPLETIDAVRATARHDLPKH